ncbi:MAG: hypothetical protein PHI14_02505 [Bacteroidales bacterium]|nr:hypothetical protein [Bacteroidales bacterium]
MKKIIALLVITFSIFSFYSCKEDKDNTPTSKPYTNISLQDAKRYVGLDYNSVKAELEAKGYREIIGYSEDNIYGFINADTSLSYTLFPNASNIIYRVNHGKMNKNIDNTLSNFEFCQGECINEVNNSSDYYSYFATNNIFFGDIFDSQEEFQNYFNQNKYTVFYCNELWESDNYLYGIEFLNLKASENEDTEINTSSNTTTTPTTPEEEQTYSNPYGIGVTFMDKSLAPEGTFEKSNITHNSGFIYLPKR